jgi:hypothetical protein
MQRQHKPKERTAMKLRIFLGLGFLTAVGYGEFCILGYNSVTHWGPTSVSEAHVTFHFHD